MHIDTAHIERVKENQSKFLSNTIQWLLASILCARLCPCVLLYFLLYYFILINFFLCVCYRSGVAATGAASVQTNNAKLTSLQRMRTQYVPI